VKLNKSLQKILDNLKGQAGGGLALPTQLPTLSGKQLHLWPIICEAVAFPWHYRHLLWKWVLMCGVLVGLLDFASEFLETRDNREAKGLFKLLFDLVFILLSMAFELTLYTIFCIRCHRLLLLGPTTEPDIFPPPLGEREAKFLLFLYIVYGSISLVLFLGSVFGVTFLNLLESSDIPLAFWTLFKVMMIPLSYVLGRYCMVFPATAVDLQPSFNWAWEQSKHIAWRLGILAGILPWLLSFIYHDTKILFGLDQYPFAYSLITKLLWFALTTIEVAVLSIAFRELSGFEKPQKHS
jgi:hypothetical protein